MAVATKPVSSIAFLQAKAAQLRIDSVRSTTEAGSGHPTSCASAAEIMAALFFSVMRYDPKNPRNPDNDVFVLSKGHAAPILYAAWSEAGLFPREKLLELRKFNSDLEGHPTPRLPFVDAATGSLGQGICVAVGIALNAKAAEASDQRVYVLLGDGEIAEGSVWEAAQMASFHQLGNLCATVDVNRLGQSQPTMYQHHMEVYRSRWEAFGWQAIIVDGHNLPELLNAYERAEQVHDRPTVVLARTLKGKGLPGIEDKENHHGKPLTAEQAAAAIAALEKQMPKVDESWAPRLPPQRARKQQAAGSMPKPPYQAGGEPVATRKAFGDALAAIGKVDPRIVVLDGDVQNSTFTEEFRKIAPERFFESYIAEQNMVGVAMGLAARGNTAFASTFACFLTRAYDFIRLAAISDLNIKLAGTHVGVSIGEDGPSQMGLEDLAMVGAQPDFTVLYPSDATSAWRATQLLAERKGPGYLRLGRPHGPVLYGPQEQFEVGKCKVLRQSDRDRVLVVAGGVTLLEALSAYEQLQKENIAIRVVDLFSVQPIDREGLRSAAAATGGVVITVEDHYAHGGLGDAVLTALADDRVEVHKLAVTAIARSGKPQQLLQAFGISADHIAAKVRSVIQAGNR
jgi:transketolase